MANKRLIETDFAISLLEEYRIENPYKKIFVEDIARKAKDYGISIKGRILRRNVKFMERFKEISNVNNEDDDFSMVAYKTFDVEKHIRNFKGIDSLIRTINQREEYYKSVCIYANKVLQENKELKKQNASLKEIDILKKRIVQLNSFIEKYINPSIADELLKRENISVGGISIIKPDILDPINPKTNLSNEKLKKLAREFEEDASEK